MDMKFHQVVMKIVSYDTKNVSIKAREQFFHIKSAN